MKGTPDVVKWRAVSMFKMLNSPPEVSMFKIKKIVIIIKCRCQSNHISNLVINMNVEEEVKVGTEDFNGMTESQFIRRYKFCEPWNSYGKQLWRAHDFRHKMRTIFQVKCGVDCVTTLRMYQPSEGYVGMFGLLGKRKALFGHSSVVKKSRTGHQSMSITSDGTEGGDGDGSYEPEGGDGDGSYETEGGDGDGGYETEGGDGDGGGCEITMRPLSALTAEGPSVHRLDFSAVLACMNDMKTFLSIEGMRDCPFEGVPSTSGTGFRLLDGQHRVMAYLTLFGNSLGSADEARIATTTNRFASGAVLYSDDEDDFY